MLGKRIINSNNAAAGGACTTNTNDYPTTNVAYYKMSSAADEKGTYNGTATDVNFNVQGKFGNAGEFNGSSSYISLPNLGISGNQAFSVSFWVYKDAATSGLDFVYFQGNLQNSQAIQLYFTANETFNVDYYFTAGYYTSSNIITLNKWHHIVATFSGGALQDPNNTDIYVDGSLVAKTASINGSGNANFGNTNYNIGRRTDGYYFDGTLDQVRIFSSALDATQVASLYNEVYCVPTIVPTSYFNSVLYPGNSSTQAITGVGFAPDFVWIKRKNSAEDHAIYDSVRGTNKQLSSNTTAEEATNSSPYLGLTSFDSDGFTSGNNGGTNRSPNTYVAWNWKAGGAEVQNNDGTIQGVNCLVSANVDAGFSIVKYTGNSTAGATVGHGLSEVPEMIIVKITSGSIGNWAIFHKDVGATKFLQFTSGAAQTSSLWWNNTAPSSSVFSLGTISDTNTSPYGYIAYAFHSVDGFSKIGSYTGTGATGNTIVTGFRPAFVMTKRTDVAGYNWYIWDNKTSPTNPRDKALYADTSGAEQDFSAYPHDFNSNGFSVDTTSTAFNANGGTYIFMAFAEEGLPTVTRNATNPFGDSSELALYKFEDDATDAEGNYDAISSPNVTYASGYIDKAAVFNGSSSYINISSLPELTANRSVSMWFKAVSIDNNDRLFGSVQGSNYFNISFGPTNDISAYTGGTLISSASNSISTNVWHNVVLVANGTSGKLYIDGNEVTSTTITSHTINPTAAYIGTNEGNVGTQVPNASIDQVRIFNRALDSGEVTALYNE